jgi:hypothetical protein
VRCDLIVSSTNVPTDEKSLFIFDNLDTATTSLSFCFWPGNRGGSILLTGRDSGLIRPYGGVVITELDDARAIILLKRMCKFSNKKLSPNELFKENAAAEQIVK